MINITILVVESKVDAITIQTYVFIRKKILIGIVCAPDNDKELQQFGRAFDIAFKYIRNMSVFGTI